MKSDGQIMDEIARAARGLFRTSESDYPVEPFRLEDGQEPAAPLLRRAAGASDAAAVTVGPPAEFFRAGAFAEAEGDAAGLVSEARLRALARALLGNLSDVAVYRVGEINIAVYVLGRSGSGSWLGVSTRVVET